MKIIVAFSTSNEILFSPLLSCKTTSLGRISYNNFSLCFLAASAVDFCFNKRVVSSKMKTKEVITPLFAFPS